MWLRRLKIFVLDLTLYVFDFLSDLVNGIILVANGHFIWGTVCILTTNIPGLVWGYMWHRHKDHHWTQRWKYYLLGWIIVPFRTVKG